ncbi:MAG: hypothetical protein FJZ58_01150 [Chlamydiae bacterium]|nr:hypothetical protein [Chlamydiota bacterium]
MDNALSSRESNPRRIKSNIQDIGEYILKGSRPIELELRAQLNAMRVPQEAVEKAIKQQVQRAAGSHIYRVRKAEKVRNYLVTHGYQDHFHVPKKYLYWHEAKQEFLVVCEKVPLADKVVAIVNADMKNNYKRLSVPGTQVDKLAKGTQEQPLTEVQAKALTELATIGLTDLTFNNFFFTPEGKVAILDTESVKRPIKKAYFDDWTTSWVWDKWACEAQQTMTGIAKLKLFCDPKALQAVEAIETCHVLWNSAILIGKIALGYLPSCIYHLLLLFCLLEKL